MVWLKKKVQPEIEQVDLELIRCTRQPGRLRISKNGCAQRYLLAKRKHLKIPNDEFGMALKSSLEICRRCPEGRMYSKVLNRRSSSHKRNLRSSFQGKTAVFSNQRKRRSNN